MRLKLLKVVPSINPKKIYFDLEVLGTGLIVKGVRIKYSPEFGISIAMPKNKTEKGIPYSPLTFTTEEVRRTFIRECTVLAIDNLKLENICLEKSNSSTCSTQNNKIKSK